MTTDMETALGLANHIISPCSDPREEFSHHNLRQHHLRLARETLEVLEDKNAKAYLSSIIEKTMHTTY